MSKRERNLLQKKLKIHKIRNSSLALRNFCEQKFSGGEETNDRLKQVMILFLFTFTKSLFFSPSQLTYLLLTSSYCNKEIFHSAETIPTLYYALENWCQTYYSLLKLLILNQPPINYI